MDQLRKVVLTHVDLDGACSGWLATRAFDTERLMSSNYHEVSEKLEAIFYSYGSENELIITDLNILPKDLEYAMTHFRKVTIFDHHPSSELFKPLQDINKNFKLYYSDKVCATTLVQKYMIDNGHEFTDLEKKYFRYVNIYDTWQSDHKEFIYGRMANDIFWMYGWSYFVDKLKKNGVFDIPTGLTHDELKHCKDTFDQIKHVGNTAEWYNTDCGSTVAILEKDQKVAINHISDYIDSQTGIYYIVYYDGYKYRCSVRVRKDNTGNYELGSELNKFIKTSEVINNCGGHGDAAGIAFEQGTDLADALTELERFDTFMFEERIAS
jgi:oligoribonuclease NrnB/cAMP/cGMP phosphodiesterase (DHH superfamily)